MSCLSACQSKMICPAFQSAFIYNDSTRNSLFAYFSPDSLPIIEPYSSKNKYGIVEKTSKKKRTAQLRIVPMERIYPPKDTYRDSLLLAMDNVPEGETMNIDSLMSIRSKVRNRYNVEQETYMRLFGQYLYFPEPPDPDEEADPSEAAPEDAMENMTRKERRQARKEARAKAKEENRGGSVDNEEEEAEEDW